MWLTCVVSDDQLEVALLFAQSLRRVKTRERIGVVLPSTGVSPESRRILRHEFDAVFVIDAEFSDDPRVFEETARDFTESLQGCGHCVFLSASNIALENIDEVLPTNARGLVHKNNGELKVGIDSAATVSFETSILRYESGKGCLPKLIQLIDLQEGSFWEQLFQARRNCGVENRAAMRILDVLLTLHKEHVRPVLELGSISPCPTKTVVTSSDPIAIVGMSCRFPGGNNVDEFWEVLLSGSEAVGTPPPFRWTEEHTVNGASVEQRCMTAGFLQCRVDEFDAKFFGISPKDAEVMDPQLRLMHEVMWEALEDSGIDALSLAGSRTGIFTGSWTEQYKEMIEQLTREGFFRTYLGTGISAAVGRLAKVFGVTGPCVATESACSSSIIAVDLAVQSLRNRDTDLAMAGGVNLLLKPFDFRMIDNVLSPDGRCKTFDASADGFGRAEGCAVLILKRLSDALHARDRIVGLIRGSAITQEGLSKSLGTPTIQCEAEVMRLALRNGGVSPEEVSFVEAHGTGTAVGDPLEIAAIAQAYSTEGRSSLVIGSVKTNIGHTESCSGMAGIIKTLLAMRAELIPKHRNLQVLNPEIQLDAIPAEIPLQPVAWPRVPGKPRLAGVSSFGITGANGHVILEEPPEYHIPKLTLGLERPLHLLKISAKSAEAMEQLLQIYESRLKSKMGDPATDISNLKDFAFSANTGRANFPYRAAVLARSYEDAFKKLSASELLRSDAPAVETPKICFLFTGQGSQYPGMAKTLYDTSPVFRMRFDLCDQILQEHYGISLRPVLWHDASPSSQLSRTLFSQTSIFCVEYCLLGMWTSWGITPDFVVGHSLGEFCAAVAAGMLDFSDALKLVAVRSRLIDALPNGNMIVIKAAASVIEDMVRTTHTTLDIAAVNTNDQTVVAGDPEGIRRLAAECQKRNLKTTMLASAHAFHSRHMDPMLPEYDSVCRAVSYKQGKKSIRYISSVTGEITDKLSADYWARHTRDKVNFLKACLALREEGCSSFLEIGPQPILSSFVTTNSVSTGVTPMCLPSLRRGREDWETMLTSLATLFLEGHRVDWIGFDEPYERVKVPVPLHPFQRKSYWIQPTRRMEPCVIHPLVGRPILNASGTKIFDNNVSLETVPYLRDHCIGPRVVFPGAAFAEMCLAASHSASRSPGHQLAPPSGWCVQIDNFEILAPLELNQGGGLAHLQTVIDSSQLAANTPAGSYRVKVCREATYPEEEKTHSGWLLHATATYSLAAPNADQWALAWDPESLSRTIITETAHSVDGFYGNVSNLGLRFGDTFKSLRKWWKDAEGGVIVESILPPDFDKYIIHPLILDSAFQALILWGHERQSESQIVRLEVPVSVGRITVFSSFGTGVASGEPLFLRPHADSNGQLNVLVGLSGDRTRPLAVLNNVVFATTSVRRMEAVMDNQEKEGLEVDTWQEIWRIIPGPTSNRVDIPPWSATNAGQIVNQSTATERAEVARKSRFVCFLMLRTFYELGWQPSLHPKGFTLEEFMTTLNILPEHARLIRFHLSKFVDESLLHFDDDSGTWTIFSEWPSEETVRSEVERLSLSPQGESQNPSVDYRLGRHVGDHLAAILKGELSALQLLFPKNGETDGEQLTAASLYSGYDGQPIVLRAMESAFHRVRIPSKPDAVLRVLEVGSGTGSLTSHALGWLKQDWGQRFEYFFTDISRSFFNNASTAFSDHKGQLTFATFNLEEHPFEQGIPLEYFDVVLCTEVLHATKNVSEALSHIRATMRPGAAFLFIETVIQSWGSTFVFGLLDGFWRFEDISRRPSHCSMSAEKWMSVLTECGFGSTSLTTVYGDLFGVFSTQLCDPSRTSFQLEVLAAGRWIVLAPAESELSQHLVSKMRQCGLAVDLDTSLPTADVSVPKGVAGIVYAWGISCGEEDVKGVSSHVFHLVQGLLAESTVPSLLILTNDTHPVADTLVRNPATAPLTGMLKSAKNEHPHLPLCVVDLESGAELEHVAAQVLYEMTTLMGRDEWSTQRLQVAYRGLSRFEPRFAKCAPTSMDDVPLNIPASLTCGGEYHLVLPETKLISDLRFEATVPRYVGQNEVEVRVKAYGLNFKDILTVLKPTPEFEQLSTVGLDFSGVVSKVGAGVLKPAVGDPVFGVNSGPTALASHVIVPSSSVVALTTSSHWEAATLPTVFATAYHCLVNIARMQRGDTVLLHTASGGVGLAAIQVARAVGATILTTAGSERKRMYLKRLGLQHVFHSRDPSFETGVLSATKNVGVDIVLNSITGPGLKEASLRCLREGGRWVEMSKLQIWSADDMHTLRSDVDYTIVDLTELEQGSWAKLLRLMSAWLAEGRLTPLPQIRFDAEYVRQALSHLQNATHIGKVVVTMPEPSLGVPEHRLRAQISLFNNQSTYLITGGLGGIGFELAIWMLGKGAHCIVLMGRRPASTTTQKRIDTVNSNQSGHIVVKYGDIGKVSDCTRILEEINKELKNPLRGVMHCAGVLRDKVFSNLEWRDFEENFNSKVAGTLNLHRLTRSAPLEHFVLFSSVVGNFGMLGQAAYAAANCFEDSFAHYRHSLGMPATVINWGQWADVGMSRDMTLNAFLPVSATHMFRVLEAVMRRNIRHLTAAEFDPLTLNIPLAKSYLDERLLTRGNHDRHGGTDDIFTTNSDQFTHLIQREDGKEKKFSVILTQLKRLLRSALRMEATDEIDDNANLQTTLGIDSLMMIELKNAVQRMTGPTVIISTSRFKECETVSEIATLILDSVLGTDCTSVAPKSEDIRATILSDIKLPSNITPAGCLPPCPASRQTTLLVTGATGQLAPQIIRELCQRYKQVSKIVCLIRPQEGSTSPEERLRRTFVSTGFSSEVDTRKIQVVSGDVQETRFGLSEKSYANLAAQVDGVIHCAAKANHVEPYRKADQGFTDIRSVNVGGMLNVLEFASTTKVKHVYFASSIICLLRNNLEGTLSDDWPTEEEVDVLVRNKTLGYGVSKFVSEHLAHSAVERGIPVKVFRFCWIAGDSETGYLNLTNNHFSLRYLTFLKMGSIPNMDVPACVLPADVCAQVSLHLFLNDDTPQELFNVFHPRPDSDLDFVELARTHFGVEVTPVEFPDWVSQLDQTPLGMFKDFYAEQVDNYRESLETALPGLKPWFYSKTKRTCFANAKVKAYLPTFGDGVPSSMSIVRQNLNYVHALNGGASLTK